MLAKRYGSPSKEMGAVGLSVNSKPGKKSKTVGGHDGDPMKPPIKSSEWLFGMQIKVVPSVLVGEGGWKHIGWGWRVVSTFQEKTSSARSLSSSMTFFELLTYS